MGWRKTILERQVLSFYQPILSEESKTFGTSWEWTRIILLCKQWLLPLDFWACWSNIASHKTHGTRLDEKQNSFLGRVLVFVQKPTNFFPFKVFNPILVTIFQLSDSNDSDEWWLKRFFYLTLIQLSTIVTSMFRKRLWCSMCFYRSKCDLIFSRS